MKYDIESYLRQINTYLQANLNTQIASLNSEKNDSLVLKSISTDAHFVQTLNDKVANYNPYILIGVDDIGQSAGIGPATMKPLTFSVVIVLQDSIEDLEIGYRCLRYLRVLEDLFNNGFNKILPHVTFKVNSLVPIAITAVNSNDPYRAVGVQLVTNLG
jgi:hypothetical protein